MGYVYALLAALLFGANGTVTKVVVESGLTPLQLTQFRVLGTAAIAGGVLLASNRGGFRLRPRQLGTMAFLGVVGVALLQASYAAALQLLPVGMTLLIEYTAVLLVALVAFFVFHERVRARLWVAIGCVLLGLAVVARIWASTLNPLGVAFSVVAALTLAIYFIFGERQVGQTSPLVVAFWTMTFAAGFWAFFSGWWMIDPAVLVRPVSLGGTLAGVHLPLWAPLAWNVVMGTFAPFFLSFRALGRLSATAAGVVATSEVVFAFLVAWLWLGEGLDLVQILGAAVVLVGIVLAQTARAEKSVDADLALARAADVGGRP
ncbi:EamA family transporter [Galbitalea soli]|uniref:EamA family transporter n=1 Tax=Galbitalea soli TaxID=1268042 RepID=A0A7C9PNI8_9MICO|nr:EamA family transporter [Galbitalea soli]NYJ30361.1 drug/metabolite transporter (DMT)-like permease [Galbitalea soli]